MGRGLSALQRSILQLAYRNHRAENKDTVRWRVSAASHLPPPPEGFAVREHDDAIALLQSIIAEQRAQSAVSLQELDVHTYTFVEESPLATAMKGYVTIKLDSFATKQEAEMFLAQHDMGGDIDPEFPPGGADLYAYEVLIEIYGFGEARKRYWNGALSTISVVMPDGSKRRQFGGQVISREAAGAQKYDAASAATSRAFRRLYERGLVVRVWHGATSGIDLTEAGVREAELLSVISPCDITTHNR
jgi:hypothetical protein